MTAPADPPPWCWNPRGPSVITEDDPAIVVARVAYLEVFGEIPETGFWTFSTNGVATAGMHGIPTIGFGPGHEHFAHAPNEQTEVEHLVRSTAFYAALVNTFAREI